MTKDIFSDIIADTMGDLIANYSLKFVKINECSVLLKRKEYAIKISDLGRFDGVSLCYYDLSSNEYFSFDLLYFLFMKRRKLLKFTQEKLSFSTRIQMINHEVSVIKRHLNDGGKDILSGDKEWLKEITWTKGFPVSPEIIPYLRG